MSRKLQLVLLAACMLLIGTLIGGSTVNAQRSGGGRQTWEYKTVIVSRSPDVIGVDFGSWSEDGTAQSAPLNMVAKRQALGAEGWELVATAAVSDTSGGMTTRLYYYFKRPK